MSADAPQQPVRIGLLGMYASTNLGDTAIQLSVMQALSQRRPDVSFSAICTAPSDARATFGLPAQEVSGFGPLLLPDGKQAPGLWTDRLERAPGPLPLAATAWACGRHMRRLDMLLVNGSGQIDDFWGGPWEQPFRLLAWASAARRQAKPVAFFGVGVDQLLTKAGIWLCRAALRRADLRVVREAGSADALRRLGLAEPCVVGPDPAFALHSPALVEPMTPAARERFVIMSPIARNAWPGSTSDEAYEHYLRLLAGTADRLQQQGLSVQFACSQTRMDPPVVARVIQYMRGDVQAVRQHDIRSIDDYLRAVRSADLVVASRLHALILAMVAGTPVVGLSYARKVRRQLEDAGLGAQCLDIDTLEPAPLHAAVDSVLADPRRMREQVSATAARLRAELDPLFDALAALVPRGGGVEPMKQAAAANPARQHAGRAGG